MSNTTVKFYLSVSILMGALMLIASCAGTQPVLTHADPVAIKVNTVNRTQEVKDSLIQNGVDSILVYSTHCRNCLETPYIPNAKELEIADSYILRAYLKPVYVFWCHNGVYQLKKMDQSFESASIEVNKVQFAHIFDFYNTNKTELNSEDYLFELYDTTYVNQSKYGVTIDTVIETTEIRYFEKEYYSVSVDQPFRNYFIIDITIGKEKETYEINDLYFNPWAPDNYYDIIRSEFPNQKVIAGNSRKNYQLNHDMKRFIWHQNIEATLFQLEAVNSWTD
ncbi:MAG: hypothetical protein Crog4KO_05900 [Crocinitomicaceae bacterium]